MRRDLRELLPLVRQRYRPGSAAVVAMRSRERDVQTTIDARLQVRVAAALRDGIASGGIARGAAVVLDAATGELLASASYPWPAERIFERRAATATADGDGAAWLDRARYGLYPPDPRSSCWSPARRCAATTMPDRFICKRLPDGRVGNYVRGMSRPVRDDAHGHGASRARGSRTRPRRVVQRVLRAARRSRSGRGRCSMRRRCFRSTWRARRRPRACGRCWRRPGTDRARRS